MLHCSLLLNHTLNHLGITFQFNHIFQSRLVTEKQALLEIVPKSLLKVGLIHIDSSENVTHILAYLPKMIFMFFQVLPL